MKFDREQIEKEALEKHAKRSKEYQDNPFMFEINRRKEIEAFIQSVPPERQEGLRKLQATWDNAMKGAGSQHNRLVIAEGMLMHHFINKFKPTIGGE